MTRITAVPTRIIYHENSFVIADTLIHGTIKGPAEFVCLNMAIILDGEYAQDTWGTHFKFYQMSWQSDLDALKALFGGGLIKGIKEGKAEALIGRYEMGIFQALTDALDDPEAKADLLKVKGIGPVVIEQVLESWGEHRGWAESAFCAVRAGLTVKLAKKCYALWGSGFPEVVRDTPYRLTRIKGISWRIADRAAKKAWPGKDSIPHNSPMRLAAAVREALRMAENQGHTCLPLDKALAEAALLARPTPPVQLEEVVRPVAGAEYLVFDDVSNPDEPMVATVGWDYAERETADRIRSLLRALTRIPAITVDAVFAELAKYTNGLDLSDGQLEAIRLALTENVVIVTGGPGTGKTTVVRTLLNILDDQGLSYTLCAPTGKAARRMEEAVSGTGLLEGRRASTIHSALGMRPDSPPRYSFTTKYIIIDECSMMDASLMSVVLEQMKRGSRLILIGDADQLPPVGPGEPFYCILESELVPSVRLKHIFRQDANSGIIHAAHAVNQGLVPTENRYDDFKFGRVGNNRALPDTVLRCLKGIMDKYRFRFDDIQVLVPVKGHEWGTLEMCRRMQELYNPLKSDTWELPGLPFRAGDRVIHLRNNYEICENGGVMNGEVGIVHWMTTVDDEREGNRRCAADSTIPSPQVLRVHYGRKIVFYTRDDCDELALAYALTVHKTQGSEYKAVILAIPGVWRGFALRQLLYTGLTRAELYCLVISAGNAAETYAANEERVRRHTRLGRMLADDADIS